MNRSARYSNHSLLDTVLQSDLRTVYMLVRHDHGGHVVDQHAHVAVGVSTPPGVAVDHEVQIRTDRAECVGVDVAHVHVRADHVAYDDAHRVCHGLAVDC